MPPANRPRKRASGQNASRTTSAQKATTRSTTANPARTRTRAANAARSSSTTANAARSSSTGGNAGSSSTGPGARRGLQGASKAAARVDHGAFDVNMPLVGRVHLPPPQHLAFYAGIGLLAAAELIEWPVALLLAAGKALADNRSHANLQDFGEALESA